MKTILITGINGFLGSNLAKTLQKNYNIIGLEYSLENLFRIKNNNFKVYSSNDNLDFIFERNKIDIIIHAATIYRRSSEEALDTLLNTNIFLPVKLFQIGIKHKCLNFFNTDSFFNSPKYNYDYLKDYTLSKKQVIEWLELIANSNKGAKLFNLKIFHMYGPGDAANKFIPSIVEKLKAGILSIDLTKGDQNRDFIFIEDVVNAIEIIFANMDRFNKITNFDIGTGKAFPIRKFVELCRDHFNPQTKLNFGVIPKRKNEIDYSCANIMLLNSIGWEPKFTLEQGIKKL